MSVCSCIVIDFLLSAHCVRSLAEINIILISSVSPDFLRLSKNSSICWTLGHMSEELVESNKQCAVFCLVLIPSRGVFFVSCLDKFLFACFCQEMPNHFRVLNTLRHSFLYYC